MPTYEYRCPDCAHQYEKREGFDAPAAQKCPQCGGKVQRLISGGAGLIFKGSGFYITDYKNAGKRPPESDKSESKKESKDSSSSSSKQSSDSSPSKDKATD